MAQLGRSFSLSVPSVIRVCLRRYRSPYSLDRLYPGSSSNPKTFSIPVTPAKPADKQFNGFIPLDKVEVQFDSHKTRSAEVRFRVEQCDWIPGTIREKFLQKFKHRIDKDGYFCVRSDRTRVGSINLADCLDKLRFSIHECAEIDDPTKGVQEEIEKLRTKQEIEAKKKLQVKKT